MAGNDHNHILPGTPGDKYQPRSTTSQACHEAAGGHLAGTHLHKWARQVI